MRARLIIGGLFLILLGFLFWPFGFIGFIMLVMGFVKSPSKKVIVLPPYNGLPPEQKPISESKVTEIIREKEVIVKIRCPYCKTLYNETLDKCPNCGANR